MTAGELIINIVVKGGDDSEKKIKSVKVGLSDAKSMALETKAAILAVIYGLEKLMSASSKTGTELSLFSASTGILAKDLQQYQYAARQVGVSNEEMESSMRNVQAAMSDMLMGKGAPEVMAMLANKVGFDKSQARDPKYMLQQLQQLAQLIPPDVGNRLITPLVGQNVFAAMRQNAFRQEVFDKAPIYNDKEVTALTKIGVAWDNLGNKIKMAIGHLNAKEGLQFVNQLSKATTQVIKLAEALAKLADKLKLFEVFTGFFEGMARSVEGVNKLIESVKSGDLAEVGKTVKDNLTTHGSNDLLKALDKSLPERLRNKTLDNKPATNVKIEQNLNFQHDGKDHKRVGDSAKKGTQAAYRQMSAQGVFT